MKGNVSNDDIYIYGLSNEVLSSLKLMVFDNLVSECPSSLSDDKTEEVQIVNEKDYRHCTTCKIPLDTGDYKNLHYKTDFHAFNIKRRLNGFTPINLEEFEQLIEKESVESLSGSEGSGIEYSESENDDIYKEDKDELSTIFENQIGNLSLNESDSDNCILASHLNTRSPQIFFKSEILPDSHVFGVYKVLFDSNTIEKPYETICEWNNQSQKYSALFMIGGGHFAGAIVSHQRLGGKNPLKTCEKIINIQNIHFLEHKTFHRYTTRRKQGGSQSSMDNSKGKANSAGSSLRRHNEAALRLDIQNLLLQWAPYLKNCHNIFIRAKNSADRQIFFEKEIGLRKNDPRIKSFPFTTKRATSTELKRAWYELTILKKIPKPQEVKKKDIVIHRIIPPSLTNILPVNNDVIEEVKHTKELLVLLKKSKAPLLIHYIKKNNLDPNYRLCPEKEFDETPTMLHYASQQNLKNMIFVLLNDLKCDPTLINNRGKTAWDLSKKDDVKFSFQIARYTLGETFTDWKKAHVGDPMTREQVYEINKRKLEEESRQHDIIIKKELEIVKMRQKEKEIKKSPGRVLESVSNIQQTLNSLSDDQKARLMREQRARAAEARMRQNLNR